MDDKERHNTISDQKKEADLLKSIIVEEPTCKNEALQNNGVCGPGAVVANITVRKPKAEDRSIQNNGYVGDKDFFSSSSKNPDL